MASARIQQYHVHYKCGELHGNADVLSRLPLLATQADSPVPEEVVSSLSILDSTPISVDAIAKWIERDPFLSPQVDRPLQMMHTCHITRDESNVS